MKAKDLDRMVNRLLKDSSGLGRKALLNLKRGLWESQNTPEKYMRRVAKEMGIKVPKK